MEAEGQVYIFVPLGTLILQYITVNFNFLKAFGFTSSSCSGVSFKETGADKSICGYCPLKAAKTRPFLGQVFVYPDHCP